MRILVIEDDPNLNKQIKSSLEDSGYSVDFAIDGEEGHFLGDTEPYDAVILDLGLPKLDGITILEKWKKEKKNFPVLILTARNQWSDKVSGFDAGADDYITKPIKPRVLLSRMKALLRRGKKSEVAKEIFEGKNITINRDRYIVTVSGKELSLPKKEFELLSLLVSQPGKVFKRSTILREVWGNDVVVGDRTIDVHIRKLREKLGNHNFKTVKGVGYKFEEE